MYPLSIFTTFCAVAMALSPMGAAAETFIGPKAYSAFDDPKAGKAVSPFSKIPFDYFFLEDFEDGLLNTPGVTIQEFAGQDISLAYSDSVDGDDGIIDGQATGDSRSLFSNYTSSSFTFTFSKDVLGKLPTHAGIVWTDIGRNGGGGPLPPNLVKNTVFEAFGPNGASLGKIGPFSLGDESISRTTEEDRFFGVIHAGGISAIRISMPGLTNWEVDHLQYGRATPEIAVQQPTGRNLVDGESRRNFGTVDLGKKSSKKVFTIKNKGTAALTGIVVDKDGGNSKDFVLIAPLKSTLQPGKSTTFSVTFKPTAKGSRHAKIHIKSNDANENPFDVELTGTCVD